MTGAKVSLDTFGLTDVGRKRDNNEDQFLIATMKRAMEIDYGSLDPDEDMLFLGRPEATLLVVADGMGGRAGGEVASSIAVRTIAQRLCEFTPFVVKKRENPFGTVMNLRRDLIAAMAASEDSILEAAQRDAQQRGMGTTLTLAYVVWPRLYLAHVGDSRCYLYRDGRVEQLTKDHTVAQQLADRGVEVGDASELHHMLWNALGANANHGSEPEVVRAQLRLDDTVLLCSDGLTKHIEPETIAQVLADEPTAEAACCALVDMANERGGRDNITVALARCVERDDEA